MSLYQTPPESLTVGGPEYPIDTDFRVWVKFQAAVTEKGTDGKKAERLCAFMEKMGLPPGEEALNAMLDFYTAASTEKAVAGQKNRPAAFDFEKDSEYIFAAFMGAYDIDLTTARLHWWTFKALFKALPEDCEFCRIMRYRTIDLKDVPKSQKRFYQEQKARYSLGEKAVYRTEKDMRDYVKRRFADAERQAAEAREKKP